MWAGAWNSLESVWKSKQKSCTKGRRNSHLMTEFIGNPTSIYILTNHISVKVLLQWKSALVYTSWTYSTYHLELALGTFMHHFISAFMPYMLGKNISKFVFENSLFQIAEAFQSLLCDGRSAAVVNESPTCWAMIVISFLFLWNQQKTCNRQLCHVHVASLILSQRFWLR